MSSGTPIRPKGMVFKLEGDAPNVPDAEAPNPASRIGVSTEPGCIELHRMLSLACWIAVALVNSRTAPLVAM